MNAWPDIAIIFLTYDRPETASKALIACLDHIHYSGGVHVHIADDGSPPGYTDTLREVAGGYAWVKTVGVTNAGRGGYGHSYNLATQAVHVSSEIILPLEDDWELLRDLDLNDLVATLYTSEIACIRLGYLGFTQGLQGSVIRAPAGAMLLFDPDSPEPHVSAGHPRLETADYERRVGPWTEGLAAGQTEFDWCRRKAAREGVAWPMDLVHPRGDLFAHIGSRGLGEIIPEGRVTA